MNRIEAQRGKEFAQTFTANQEEAMTMTRF